MSTGGLTGTGGGSIAGATPPPLAKQPDGASLISYAQASSSKPEGGGKAGTDTKAGGDGWAQSEEQSQKLQDFDAVRGRPSLGDERQGDGQEGEREGGFVGCAAGAAKDVVVGTVKGLYETVKDAGGAVADKLGADGYEGHTERTAGRVEAVVGGGKKVIGVGVDAGAAALDKVGVGDFEEAADRTAARGKAIGEAASDEWAEFKAEIDKGDSCALGERVGTTVGAVGTVAIPGGAAVKGVKVLAKIGGRDGADGPNPATKAEMQDVEKSTNPHNDSFGSVTGTYSKRPFNPEKAGGPILDLDYKDANITKEGIREVEVHVNRFDDNQPNNVMVERLHKIADGEIEATDYDRKFFTHEQRELERYRNLGIPDDAESSWSVWNDTHTATLEDFKLTDYDSNRKPTLYHPDTWGDFE